MTWQIIMTSQISLHLKNTVQDFITVLGYLSSLIFYIVIIGTHSALVMNLHNSILCSWKGKKVFFLNDVH